MDADMDKLNSNLAEFKKYVHDKSFEVEVCYNIINYNYNYTNINKYPSMCIV